MDEKHENYIDSEQFSLETILAEYLADEEISSASRSEIEERSHRIMVEAIGDTISAAFEEPPLEEPDEDTDIADELFSAADESETYAPADFAEFEEPEEEPAPKQRPVRKKSFAETVMAPVLSLLASVQAKQQHEAAAFSMAPEAEDVPELLPKRAARLYALQLRSLVFRSRAALFLAILAGYITIAFYGKLPLFGALKDIKVCSLVSLIILLSVMTAGIDILTTGVRSLLAAKPAGEALIALSCLFSIIDAVLTASGKSALGLPLCAVSAWSVCMGIWGSRWTCSALCSSFSTLADAEDECMAITTEPGIVNGYNCVVKAPISTDNFVRRSECADLGEISHTVAAPYFIIVSLVLAVFTSIKLGAGAFIHVSGACIAASAALTSLTAFPMPFAACARRLRFVGAAVAGYEGCADIGAAKRFVVLDRDLFPPHTISIDKIQIVRDCRSDKVIGYTGSLLSASGCALAGIFAELMKKNNCSMSKVEDFQYHEGGGIMAHINDEEVLIGSSSFMSLMGIRLPPGLTARNAVFTVINGSLAGIFTITYAPTASVKRALEILLRDYKFPIFAVRDFNINPMMIRQKFKVVTDDFEFPTYAERYRVSAVEHDEGSPIAAAATRHGLGTMVECTANARRLYIATRILVILSIVSAVLGIAFVMLLCRGGAPAPDLAAKVLIFMLLWLVPSFVISHSFR